MTKILLLVCLKEPIRNPVVKLMNTSLKAHTRYFKFLRLLMSAFLKSLQR